MTGSVKPPQGKNKTLSQRCQDLVLRAACIDEIKTDVLDPVLKYYAEASPPRLLATDPVYLAWRLIRQGSILCLLLNNLRSGLLDSYHNLKLPIEESVFTDDDAHENVKSFLIACRDSLYKTEDQLFPEFSLFTDDSNTLAKAISLTDGIFDRMKIIKRLDFAKMTTELQARDKLYSLEPPEEGDAIVPGQDSSLRLLVLKEMLETERKYVIDLEALQHYAGELKMDQIIPVDVQEALFSNLDDLVGFQRLFLTELEMKLTKSRLSNVNESYKTDVASLFINNEKGFSVYEVFCPNHPRAIETAMNEFESLMKKSRLMEPRNQLNDYLIKPIQRLCKYPLLIRELLKQSPEDAPDRKDLEEAYAVVNRVTMRVNDMKRKAEMAQAAELLFSSMKEWKGLERKDLGELLLYDPATAVMGDNSKELEIYLFENVMVMTGKGKQMRELLSSNRNKNQVILKGHIWISRIISVAKAPTNPSDTSFSMKMTYRTSEIEYCTLRFKMEDKVKTWVGTIQPLIEAAKRKEIEAAAAAVPPLPSKERRRRSLIAAVTTAPLPGIAPNTPAPVAAAATAATTAGMIGTTLPRIEDEPLRLKIRYEEDIFVVGVYKDVASLYELKSIVLEKILTAFKILNKPCLMSINSMSLTYADEQRDWISLLDDTDVDTALTFSPHSLVVRVTSAASQPLMDEQ